MILIKKVSEEIVYTKICKNITVEVNGKSVHIDIHSLQDDEAGVYESDQEINEIDLAILTDEEHETLGENLTDILSLEVGAVETFDED